jgi:lipopolysaccharide heptosyltransferase I
MLSLIRNCNRILIIKLSSIGDVVMTTPVAEMLRNSYPKAHIAWVVEDRCKDALIGNPYLDEVIVWNRGSGKYTGFRKTIEFWCSLERLGRELRSRRFDVAIDFQGLFRSAVVGLFSGARYRVGSDDAGECATFFYNRHARIMDSASAEPRHRISLKEMIDAFIEKRSMLFPIDDADREFASEFLSGASTGDHTNAALSSGFVGMCPATTWPQKHWTERGWAELGDLMSSEHGLIPVFLGSNSDSPLIARIRSLMKQDAIDASGQTTLKQAAAIIERCRLVVAVDTGLLHISMAMKRPTIGLFGPTRWEHFNKVHDFVAVSKGRDCMPCLRHPSCKNFDCMMDITPDDIIKAAGEWLLRN